MLRLCFERLTGHEPINDEAGFSDWLSRNLPNVDYKFCGYMVENLADTWFGSNTMWFIRAENDIAVLAQFERLGWIIDGYAIHAHVVEHGKREVKIDNDRHRISREAAMALV